MMKRNSCRWLLFVQPGIKRSINDMLSHKNEVQPVANGIRQRIKIDYSSVTFVDPGVQIDKT